MKIEIDGNKIVIPDGCRVRQEGNTIFFEPKEDKIKRWEDFKGIVGGYCITDNSCIEEVCRLKKNNKSMNIARTEAHCKAMLADG